MFVLFGKTIYHITSAYYSPSEKVLTALIVTGECGAETIVDNNGKAM